MELPKYHEAFIPVLKVLNTVESIKGRELSSLVRDRYYSHLPQELFNKKNKSGYNVLINRIDWAKSYLKMAKFVTYPQRGMVQITNKGKKALRIGSLTLQDLQSDADFINHREAVISEKEKETEFELETENISNASPQDLIDSGFSTIETEVKTELLERLKEIDPYYFEKVILILLRVLLKTNKFQHTISYITDNHYLYVVKSIKNETIQTI